MVRKKKVKIHKFISIYGSPTVYSDMVCYALETALKDTIQVCGRPTVQQEYFPRSVESEVVLKQGNHLSSLGQLQNYPAGAKLRYKDEQVLAGAMGSKLVGSMGGEDMVAWMKKASRKSGQAD